MDSPRTKRPKRRASSPMDIPGRGGPTSMSNALRRRSENSGSTRRPPVSFSASCRDLFLPEYGKSPPPKGVTSPRSLEEMASFYQAFRDQPGGACERSGTDSRSISPQSAGSDTEEEASVLKSPSPTCGSNDG